LKDNIESIDKNALQEETDIAKVKEEDLRQDSKPVMDDEDIKLHQSIEAEDFDRWLTE
jgi:hypothetical protein